MKKIVIDDLDAIEETSVRMHLSRPATMKEDGWEDGLTYTDDKKQATNVCVWYNIQYKDGQSDMEHEIDFNIKEHGTIEKAMLIAEKYSNALSNLYKTEIDYY